MWARVFVCALTYAHPHASVCLNVCEPFSTCVPLYVFIIFFQLAMHSLAAENKVCMSSGVHDSEWLDTDFPTALCIL